MLASGMLLSSSDRRIRVCILHQSDCRIRYRTYQIVALGYVSRINHIIEFGYLVPIPAFGYSFLVNDLMESGGRTKRVTFTRNFGLV